MRFSSITGGTPAVGDKIQQIQSDGKKALGYVVSYDSETNVLKYYSDRSIYFSGGGGIGHTDFVGMSTFFNSSGKSVGFNTITSVNKFPSGWNGTISGFSGITTTISNKVINLGVEFTNGLANPEINNKSGDIIYIDNRSTVSRNSRQKEDVKIILEF